MAKRLAQNLKPGDRVRLETADGQVHEITVDALVAPVVYILPVGYTNPRNDHFEFGGSDEVEVLEEGTPWLVN